MTARSFRWLSFVALALGVVVSLAARGRAQRDAREDAEYWTRLYRSSGGRGR